MCLVINRKRFKKPPEQAEYENGKLVAWKVLRKNPYSPDGRPFESTYQYHKYLGGKVRSNRHNGTTLTKREKDNGTVEKGLHFFLTPKGAALESAGMGSWVIFKVLINKSDIVAFGRFGYQNTGPLNVVATKANVLMDKRITKTSARQGEPKFAR
jgi:hypothetical protein